MSKPSMTCPKCASKIKILIHYFSRENKRKLIKEYRCVLCLNVMIKDKT